MEQINKPSDIDNLLECLSINIQKEDLDDWVFWHLENEALSFKLGIDKKILNFCPYLKTYAGNRVEEVEIEQGNDGKVLWRIWLINGSVEYNSDLI